MMAGKHKLLLVAAALVVVATAIILCWHPWRHAAVAVNPPLPLPPVGREISAVRGVSIKLVCKERAFGTKSSVGVLGPDQSGKCELKAESWKLDEILAYNSPYDLFDEARLPEGYYDVSAAVKGSGQEGLWKLTAQAYEKTFNVKISVKKRERDVYLLQVRGGKPPGLRPTRSERWGYRTAGKGFEFRRYDMAQLASFLERQLYAPVFDETGLKGEYDFELAHSLFDQEILIGSVRQLGLKLAKTKRELDIVVVERAAPGR